MIIKKATEQDCRHIAELALLAGEGIPAYFWEQDREDGQDIIDVGANNAASDTENFSYRNTWLALVEENTAAMVLAYQLPSDDEKEDLEGYPEFIRPLIELEQCVPGSYYINMLATYSQYRNHSIGSKLLELTNANAKVAGCELLSIQVFEQNQGALRLYQRLGYKTIERRKVIPHKSHPYTGDILLLTKNVV